MCQMAQAAMELATHALLGADLHSAEHVIGEHEKIRTASVIAEEASFALMALHAPIGRDLREVVGAIQIVADLERMGALALHVAEAARRRHPQRAVPAEAHGYFTEMGRIAVELGDHARQVIVSHDLGRARHIREADDAMDDLHRHLFTVMVDREWAHGTTTAVDVTLLSRYYERFADHAVQISRRVIFQATGHGAARAKIGNFDPAFSPPRLPTASSA
jgi:phosphate transport system protein